MKSALTPAPRYNPAADYLRIATATPRVRLADVAFNLSEIKRSYDDAVKRGASLVVFPELSLTGYTIGDLLLRPALQAAALRGLRDLAAYTTGRNAGLVVGLPVVVGNALYNCAAFVAEGVTCGLVPKQNLPSYGEFYEKRWFQTWDDRANTVVTIDGVPVAFGRDQLFAIGSALIGIEICEDLWVPEQPSTRLASQGASIIVNPSASPEAVTKPAYRRGLVTHTSARNVVGYVYAGAGPTESTADIVMSGHSLISELGTLLAERAPFADDPLLLADIDVTRIQSERVKTTNFPNMPGIEPFTTGVVPCQRDLRRLYDPHPFIPSGSIAETSERLDTILTIQATGLAMRLKSTGIGRMVLGLSGGLDSTLALLVAVRAAGILEADPGAMILTLTMPSVASSRRTQSNAVKLARALGVANKEIPIADMAAAELAAIGHAGGEDVTYENTQARLRQALLFNTANAESGLVIGTGDMSEIALGWSTYNGDHMSHYNPNASIPKTLVRTLVAHAAKDLNQDGQSVISDILATPVSPELTGDGSGISQSTEDLIGPYELHDFFLYHFLRWSEPQAKIAFLAEKAFKDRYTADEIHRWLDVFTTRFYRNQYKRQAMPDGAKVGLSLNPKGDWRMPAEAAVTGI